MGQSSILRGPEMRAGEPPVLRQPDRISTLQAEQGETNAYPVWTQLGEKEMLYPVHVVLWASVLNQAHCT